MDVEDIPVTSPTSLQRRESMQRGSSSFDASDLYSGIPSPSPAPSLSPAPSPVTTRATLAAPARTGRRSLFARAPPPPPPVHPPLAVSVSSPAISNNNAPRPSSGGYGRPSAMMPRPSSNPSLTALAEDDSPRESHGYSLGPTSNPLAGERTSNRSFMSRRGGTRKSILSLLTREKEAQSSIPEDITEEVTCEGFLTKRGHVFTNWKMRYFVLRGKILEYYSGEDKAKKYGRVMVAKVAPWSGESHGFMFYTTKQVPYYVYASSEAERAKWLRALKEYSVEPEEVTCEGYLTRRGHLVPSQRFAYYVLNGTSLRHYADQAAYRDNQSAIAETEIRSLSSWDGESNGLMFQTVTGNVFYAIAETVPEQQKWLASVSKATANLPEPVACAGYLTKQGHKRKSWKKRYFVLRGSTITYFTDYEMANSVRGKPLAEVVVEDVQRWDGEPFGFMFMTSEQVPYYVYADNERERAKWMNALRKLSTVPEEPEVEKKRCPNCNAVLTGSRFCGACGFNLRGSVTERRTAANKQAMSSDPTTSAADGQDDADLDDENAAFDELEALSEGARTLLLAVMQTPEGIDVGGDNGFPARVADPPAETEEHNEQPVAREVPVSPVVSESKESEQTQDDLLETPVPEVRRVAPTPGSPPPRIEIPKTSDKPYIPRSPLSPPSPVAAPPTPPRRRVPEPAKREFKPNFAIVEQEDVDNASFTSFSEEEEKAQPKPVPVPEQIVQGGGMVQMGALGAKKTAAMLAQEDSSDEDDDASLPTKPPTMAFSKAGKEEKEVEEKMRMSEEKAHRKSSADSLELDTTGIAAFDAPLEYERPQAAIRSAPRVSERGDKNDIYYFMERELDFTPLFVPSADSPVRCRLYSSMAFASATKVIMFISDSGPLGMWRQDPIDQTTTVEHKWSMARYLGRAQEEGYGIILCNPYSNTAVVYEAGGFERVVPVPNSSTPRDHVLFVWERYASKCKGQVSIVAFARGGALVKSVLETHEESSREKIHRIAFIESKHETDGNESNGVLELLGRRSINWEGSFESLGTQIVESQLRVGCVCLSVGYMPQNAHEPENYPALLEKAENPTFAFIGANPERPGMTAVVKWVRSELRRRKHAATSTRQNRNSNILVIGEAEGGSDLSANSPGNGKKASRVREEEDRTKEKPGYYLPKPSPKPHTPESRSPSDASSRSGSDRREQMTVAKDFDLLQVVGQGGFGKVFLARKRTPPDQGECYAMKVLKKQHVISSGLVNTTMAERQILTEIRHPFIVRLHYAFQDASKLYLVMDYLSGGSLAAHLRRRRKFPEEWARFYAAEVAAAIAHLHSVNIIYRDAKLENVLLDHEGHVRITDFGLSKVGVSDLKGATTFCGTAAYIAPELLKGNSYGKAADWWSFGILLYEMIAGKPPYYHRNRDIMFQTILKQEWVTFSPSFSDTAVSLIRGLLTRDPMMRLGSGPRGADDVLTHPFFEGVHWEDLLEKRIQPPFNPGVGRLDTHYAPRLNNNEITARDRQGSVVTANRPPNDFDGFSFVGRSSSLS